MNERDLFDNADPCACPSSAELSKAVSVSLGLDTVSSPLNNMNQCSSSAFADFEPGVESSSRGVPELGAARNMNLENNALLVDETNLREEVDGLQQVSCMELLRSGEMDSAQSVTRGPVISRYVCKESNLFMSQMNELPAPSQVETPLPLEPYPSYPVNPDRFRQTPGMWCAYSGRSEPVRGAPDGHNSLCKYCNGGQACFGSRHECHCVWYNKGEQGGKGGTRSEEAQGYGQVESYQRAIPQGHANFSAIKTEPSVWVNCTDRTFR